MAAGAVCAGEKSWFNGGIGQDWPNDASMSGGAWCENAAQLGQMSGAALQFSADEDAPLLFNAAQPKSLGEADAAAKSVAVSLGVAFRPYGRAAMPDIPARAKGAVILVTDDANPDSAKSGNLFFAAYDAVQGTNVWVDSGVAANADVELSLTVRVSAGDAGFLNVGYDVPGLSTNVIIRQADAVVRSVAYAGDGQAFGLSSTYEPCDLGGVAEIVGGGVYETVQAAVDAANAGDSVRLLCGVTNAACLVVDKELTIDLNGFAMCSPDKATVDVYGLSVAARLVIDGTVPNSSFQGNISVTNAIGSAGDLLLRGGNYPFSSVTAFYATTTTLDGVTMACDEAGESALQLGGEADIALSAATARLTIQDSQVSGVSAVYVSGGVLTVSNSTLTATGGETGVCGTGDAVVIRRLTGGPDAVVEFQSGTVLVAAGGRAQIGVDLQDVTAGLSIAKSSTDTAILAPVGTYWKAAGDVLQLASATIVPGKDQEPIPTKAEAEAAAAVAKVARPAGIGDSVISAADYANLFVVKAVELPAGAGYVLQAELAPSVSNAVQQAVDATDASASIAGTATSDTPTALVTTQAGLFYGLAASALVETLDVTEVPESKWVLGDGSGQQAVCADKPEGDAGFYQLRVRIDPPQTNAN